MTQIINRHDNKTIDIHRMIDRVEGGPGPLFLIFGGIHGNEPSGIFAMQRIFDTIRRKEIPVAGKIVGIAGNLCALTEQIRYCEENLNRSFLEEKAKRALNSNHLTIEEKELSDIVQLVDQLTKESESVYFVDCHSTSAVSEPFISLNTGYPGSYDFVAGLPVNTVIGLERELEGCLSEFYNRRGYHGLTFEGGQHDALETIQNHEAILWQLLVRAGLVRMADITEEYNLSQQAMAENLEAEAHTYLKVTSSYIIEDGETFVMEPGFVNLQQVYKGQLLAHNNGREIHAPSDGRILMPLYQKQGVHGYFFVKEVTDTQHLRQEYPLRP